MVQTLYWAQYLPLVEAEAELLMLPHQILWVVLEVLAGVAAVLGMAVLRAAQGLRAKVILAVLVFLTAHRIDMVAEVAAQGLLVLTQKLVLLEVRVMAGVVLLLLLTEL
jgi:hypothetical protein